MANPITHSQSQVSIEDMLNGLNIEKVQYEQMSTWDKIWHIFGCPKWVRVVNIHDPNEKWYVRYGKIKECFSRTLGSSETRWFYFSIYNKHSLYQRIKAAYETQISSDTIARVLQVSKVNAAYTTAEQESSNVQGISLGKILATYVASKRFRSDMTVYQPLGFNGAQSQGINIADEQKNFLKAIKPHSHIDEVRAIFKKALETYKETNKQIYDFFCAVWVHFEAVHEKLPLSYKNSKEYEIIHSVQIAITVQNCFLQHAINAHVINDAASASAQYEFIHIKKDNTISLQHSLLINPRQQRYIVLFNKKNADLVKVGGIKRILSSLTVKVVQSTCDLIVASEKSIKASPKEFKYLQDVENTHNILEDIGSVRGLIPAPIYVKYTSQPEKYRMKIEKQALIFERAEGSLKELLENSQIKIDEKNLIFIWRDIIHGLQGMYTKGYVHGDVTLSNVLYIRDRLHNIRALITDFDFTQTKEELLNNATSLKKQNHPTWSYTSFDYLDEPYVPVGKNKEAHMFKLAQLQDMFACGIILYTMITGKEPDWLDEMEKTVEAKENIPKKRRKKDSQFEKNKKELDAKYSGFRANRVDPLREKINQDPMKCTVRERLLLIAYSLLEGDINKRMPPELFENELEQLVKDLQIDYVT